MTVSRDKTFTGKLTRAIGRDRRAGTVVLGKRDLRVLAINAAAGGVEYPAYSIYPHRFKNVLGEIGAFPKIDVRLGHGLRDVGVSREMKDGVAASPGQGN